MPYALYSALAYTITAQRRAAVELFYALSFAYHLVKRNALNICKSLISVAENPIHRLTFLIEYHLNVLERDRDCVKAHIMLVILLVCRGGVVAQKLIYDNSLFSTEFLHYLLSVLCGVFERVAVAQRDKAVYAVYRLCRNKTAAVHSDKVIAKLVLKLGKGHSCFEYAPVRHMNISVLLFHKHIQYVAYGDNIMLSVGNKGYCFVSHL